MNQFHSYSEALDWVHSLLRFGQKPGLERMQWILEQLNHPERRLAFIHVAGTNGKGSTCAFLGSMLREAGYSVGMFTSPYVTNFRERITYNGQMIGEEDFLRLVNQLKPLVDRCTETSGFGSPTEFEVVTLIALMYFADVVRPAVVVWEAGLGGRLDSTNVVFPLVSVITNIGTDHTDVLGDSLEKIAAEKAGIIKPGVPLVVGDVAGPACDVILKKAEEKRASVYRLGRDFQVETRTVGTLLEQRQIAYRSLHRRTESVYRIGLPGKHQTVNAAVALMTIDVLRQFFAFLLEEEEISRALERTHWPGRLEVITRSPLIVLDGAHNAEGMEALSKSMKEWFSPGTRITILFAALRDKPLAQMAAKLKAFGPPIDRICMTTFDFPRAATMEQMADGFRTGGWEMEQLQFTPDWRGFLHAWQAEGNGRDSMLVVCGSLYFIAQVREYLKPSSIEAGE